jgi:hypothetical protein
LQFALQSEEASQIGKWRVIMLNARGAWGLGAEVGVGVVDEQKPTDQPKRRIPWLGRAEPLLDFDIGRGVSAIIDVLNVR